MGGESWEVRQGWATNDHVSDWFGVTVNAQSRVVELDLNFNNLCGKRDAACFALNAHVERWRQL